MNIEVQVINKILTTKSNDFLTNVGIDSSFFNTVAKQLGFINYHKTNYGVIPDVETFKQEFPEFPVFKVDEPEKYLVDKLQEQAIFNDLLPHAQQFSSMLQQDATKAIEYFTNKMEEVKSAKSIKQVMGRSYKQSAKERYDNYVERTKIDGILGISTGIDELDDILGGLEHDDFVAVIARPNVGKSWFGLFLAYAGLKQGKRVGFYSGEMSAEAVSMRLDTLASHISNRGIARGNKDVEGDYRHFIDTIDHNVEGDLVIVTTEDFDYREPTAPMLKQFIEANKVDLMIIDQLSLMMDINRSRVVTDRYNNIVKETHLMMQEVDIPVVMLCQAGRKASEVSKSEEKTPDLHHVEYCDRVGQFVTKAISLNEQDGILRVCPKKNRNGKKNTDILMKWDKDMGYLEPMLAGEDLQEMSEEYEF